jgi:hypothetical protein
MRSATTALTVIVEDLGLVSNCLCYIVLLSEGKWGALAGASSVNLHVGRARGRRPWGAGEPEVVPWESSEGAMGRA